MRSWILGLAVLCAGCGGSTDFVPEVSQMVARQSAVLSERQLAVADLPIRSDVLVTLRLEPAGVDHSQDLGESGVDRVRVEFSELGAKSFSLDSSGFSARLLDPQGNRVLELTAGTASGQANVQAGIYTWEFRNLGAATELVFVRGEGLVLTKSVPGVDLSSLDFSGLDLSGRDFRGASFRGASLLEANCSGADFSGCDLSNALFSLANCDGAKFVGAAVSGGHFFQTSFQGADIGQAISDRDGSPVRAQAAVTFPGQLAVFEPPSIVVTSGASRVIASAGAPTVASFDTITLEDGAVLEIFSDCSLQVNSLVLNGEAQLRFVGTNGAPGLPGENSGPGTIEDGLFGPVALTDATPAEPGTPGRDGENTSTGVLKFDSVSGSGHLNIVVRPGTGGAGGKGGNGLTWIGPPSSGAMGGPGGRGGDAENISIYAPASALGYFVGASNPGSGGAGGAGGIAGIGTGTGTGTGIDFGGGPTDGQSGAPGVSGTPGHVSLNPL